MQKNRSKKHFIIILLFCLPLLSACKKLGIEKELRIDLGTNFENDYVKIQLDDDVIFSDYATTNQTIGMVRSFVFDYPIGKYELSVAINGIEKTEKFRHKKDRFVYISFDRNTSNISIDYPDEKYVYD